MFENYTKNIITYDPSDINMLKNIFLNINQNLYKLPS